MGQQAIEPGRVMEKIQQALIRQHYLTGEANGKWDATHHCRHAEASGQSGLANQADARFTGTEDAGLGPDYSGAINAKGSSFADPPPVATIPPPQAEGFGQAAGVSR